MKLHFEPNLDFQLAAIEAVCDLFRGQEICRTSSPSPAIRQIHRCAWGLLRTTLA